MLMVVIGLEAAECVLAGAGGESQEAELDLFSSQFLDLPNIFY